MCTRLFVMFTLTSGLMMTGNVQAERGNARNVKIITRNGMVTLRGPVENESEKMKLQHIATQAPGAVQVDNQLEINAP